MREIPHFYRYLLLHAEIKGMVRAYTCWLTLLYSSFPRSASVMRFFSGGVPLSGDKNENICTSLNFFLHFCSRSYEKLQHFCVARQLYINFCLMWNEVWKSEIGKWKRISVAKGCFLFFVCAVYPTFWCQSFMLLHSLLSRSQDHTVYQCFKFERNRNAYA